MYLILKKWKWKMTAEEYLEFYTDNNNDSGIPFFTTEHFNAAERRLQEEKDKLKATESSYVSTTGKKRKRAFDGKDGEEKERRPANAPYVDVRRCHSPDVSSERRCMSKGRGSIYDPVFGICCHFCRQKKLCGEEDCKRCNDLDVDQPCLGKTDCSVCHSSNGVLCRACLKVRYGEEMEEVRNNKQWKCPHCIEDEGSKPYWVCNSYLCLKKRKIAPTGIAIFRAREMGYDSIAHLMMDELQRRGVKI
ncbi:uncharacterized protein LOC143616791 [Bidens hawaiensis]|uniref:uncharacterized protein LOC143616791 n=1 Tax=Bidens hawaiensis TaxID=980011 RepID=UPI004049E647